MIRHTPGLVGSRVARVEDDRFLNGRGRYLDDMAPAGALHLTLVRSPVAHGRIMAISPGEFDPMPAGSTVFTGEQAPYGIRAPISQAAHADFVQPVLAPDIVRYAGEPVAAVLHADPYVAEDAAECVEVEYEPLPVVVDVLDALRDDAPRVHEGWDDNLFVRRLRSFGDLDAARDEADRVVRQVFRTHRQAGVPLENRGCVAVPDARGRLTLWSSTQVPHMVRSYVAGELGLAEHQLRVTAPDVGGGFGVKGHVFAEEVLCCWLALETGRPVKWVEDRREHLLSSIHARDHLHVMEALVKDDGRFVGLRAQVLVDAGAYSVYPWTAGSDSGMVGKVLTGPYDIQNYEVEDLAVATNKCPLGTYRGVGRPSAVFSMERLMDEVARACGLDPAEVRRRNVIREFPYRTATGLDYDPGSYAESLEKAQEAVDYPVIREEQAGTDADTRIGVGIALYNEQTAHGTLDFELRGVPIESGYQSVSLTIDPDGTATLTTGLQSHGQSLETTLAQVVAAELELPMDTIRVVHGDTGNSPYGWGTWGSRGAVLGGGAASEAATRLRTKILRIAAHHLEVDPEDMELTEGTAQVRGAPERSVPLADVAYWANRRTAFLPDGEPFGLQETVFLDGPPRGTFSNACHVAVVEVDRRTGKVGILRYVVVEDCGTMINPMVVDGQIVGGVAQGIGSALLEEFTYLADGQPASSTFMDYLLPTSTDVPDVEIHHLETPSPNTTYGMKGMGEAGSIGPMAAVANAVSDALDVNVHETPLRMGRVWDIVNGDGQPDPWDFSAISTHPRLASFWP